METSSIDTNDLPSLPMSGSVSANAEHRGYIRRLFSSLREKITGRDQNNPSVANFDISTSEGVWHLINQIDRYFNDNLQNLITVLGRHDFSYRASSAGFQRRSRSLRDKMTSQNLEVAESMADGIYVSVLFSLLLYWYVYGFDFSHQ